MGKALALTHNSLLVNEALANGTSVALGMAEVEATDIPTVIRSLAGEKKSALLSKESILAAQDVVTEVVDVPEWGGSVGVRGLTGAERDAFEGEVIQRNGHDVTTNTRTPGGNVGCGCRG